MSDLDTSDVRSPITSRVDSSLGVITKKFISLLKNAPNNEIDLNYAASLLEIHKRRLYDITNVLEGVGYIKKRLKNSVQYIGEDNITGCPECGGAILAPARDSCEVAKLLKKEKELDERLDRVNNELQRLANEEENIKLAYVTYADIKGLEGLSSLSLLAVKTPPGTLLDFPGTEEPRSNVLTLTSPSDKIDVFYLQDISE